MGMARKKGSAPQEKVGRRSPFPSPRAEAAFGILQTADVLRRYFTEVFRSQGVTVQQYNVLSILRGAHPDGLATMDVAERMLEKTPGITRFLDQLEKRGLVERERSADDRRSVRCSITDEGLELLAILDEPAATADAEALGMLKNGQVRKLVELLDKIRAGHA